MEKKFVYRMLGGVAIALFLVIVLITTYVANTGQSVDVGGVVVSPPSKERGGPAADPGFGQREKDCVANGGSIVRTPVMNVCVP